MKLICKITDNDIGENYIEIENPKTRLGARLLWETPNNALKLITECYDKLVKSDYESVYATKFVVLRDRKILEYYINKYQQYI